MKRKATPFEKKVFIYLNELRKSGETNMFGARPYIVSQFSVNRDEAATLLSLWMNNFDSSGAYDEIIVPKPKVTYII